MKVAIDTRHDTLEEAIAVVSLAFGSSGNGATNTTRRPAKHATSSREERGRRAVIAEREATSTAEEASSRNGANGSRRRAQDGKTAAAKNAPPKKATNRKAVKAGSAKTESAVQPRNAKKTAASEAPAKTSIAARTATDEGVASKAKRGAAKKPTNVALPRQSENIRAWARSRGMQVADAGRLSAAVIAAYDAEHS